MVAAGAGAAPPHRCTPIQLLLPLRCRPVTVPQLPTWPHLAPPQRHIGYGTMFGAPLMNDGMPLSRRDYTVSACVRVCVRVLVEREAQRVEREQQSAASGCPGASWHHAPARLLTRAALHPHPTHRLLYLHQYTEPTIVYNSGLVSALAGLSEYYDVKPWAGELKEARSAAQMPGYAAYLKKP